MSNTCRIVILNKSRIVRTGVGLNNWRRDSTNVTLARRTQWPTTHEQKRRRGPGWLRAGSSHVGGKAKPLRSALRLAKLHRATRVLFLADKVEDATKKKAILLASVPAETFQLIKDPLAPTKPSAATAYDSIVQAVQNHVKPEKSALVSRYAFDTRVLVNLMSR